MQALVTISLRFRKLSEREYRQYYQNNQSYREIGHLEHT